MDPHFIEKLDDNKIDFIAIRKSFNLKNKKNFAIYMSKISKDLCTLSECGDNIGVNKLSFIDFFKLPIFICEKFFYSISKNQKKDYICYESLVMVLTDLYFGHLEDVAQVIFDIFDFDFSGKVYRENIKTLLSYLPLKEDKTKINYLYQLESLNELNEILSKTFKKKPFLLFNEFLSAITGKSDIFIQLVCYLYQKCPFKEDTIKITASKSPKLDYRSDKIKSLNLNKLYQLDETLISQDFNNIRLKKLASQTPKFNSVKGVYGSIHSNILSSPSDKTSFSPLRDYLLNESLNSSDLRKNSKKVSKMSLKSNKDIESDILSGMNGMVRLFHYTFEKKNKTQCLTVNIDKKLNTKPLSKLKQGLSFNEKEVEVMTKFINRGALEFSDNSKITTIVDFHEEDLEKEDELTNEEINKKIIYEGHVYQYNKENDSIHYFWICLIGREIFYYENYKKMSLIKVKNLLGCFIKDLGDLTIKGENYSCFSIIFRSKVRNYLVKTKNECKDWIHHLRVSLDYKNFFEIYEMLDDLGCGSYGTVKLGIYIKTKQKVAIKIIQKSRLKSEELNMILTEIDVLKFVKHPNIVNFLDHFENSEYIFIILEYIKYGDLREYLNKKKEDGITLSEERAVDIANQIAQGLFYLHSFGIIHRDLKLENIMISKYEKNKTFEVKILDFGLSKIIGPYEKSDERYGTLYYISPEIVLNYPHNASTDIWSYGVLLYNLLSGEFPFDDESKSKKKIATKIAKNVLEYPIIKWKNRTKECMDLISKCLNKEMDKRITVDEIIEHPWFKKFDLIIK